MQFIRDLCVSKTDLGERDNRGYTLVELIVVIALMAALTGMVTLSISIIFSRDASACAIKINDALSDARMLAMSKEGEYSVTFTTVSGKYMAIISGGSIAPGPGGSYTENYREEICLEGKSGEGKKISSITYNSEGQSISDSQEIKIIFDKTKGNVYSINGTALGADDNSIVTFNIVQLRGNKTSKVSLATATGKHTVGDF